MNDLAKKIEALLFWKAEPVSIKRLSEWLQSPVREVTEALSFLEQSLTERGIVLLRREEEITLGTSPTLSGLIEKLTKEELSRDIGKAGLETLSIVLYYGPVTRSEIDYVRGVNSTFTLRALLMRGLVERIQNKEDMRAFLYKPTFELLSYLGISDISKLPEYGVARAELEAFKRAQLKQDAEQVVENT